MIRGSDHPRRRAELSFPAKKLIVVMCICVIATALFADGTDLTRHNWRHPNEVVVTDLETAFTSEYIGPSKNESVFIWVYEPDGSLILFSLFHVDSLLLDRWGMYAMVVDPDGETHWITKLPKGREMSFDETRLLVTDGATTVSANLEVDPVTGSLECDFGGFTCSVDFVNRLPPWKPGTGRENYTDDGSLYQMRILVSPWSLATGTVSVDGAEFPISGHGYIIKTRFSNPLTRFAPAIHALKLYDDDEFIYLLDVTLADAYDNRVVRSLAYAVDDAWALTSDNYDLSVTEYGASEQSPYPIPKVLEFCHAQDGRILEGVFTVEKLLNITHVLDELPRLVREIINVFFRQPVYYRFLGTFKGTLREADGTVRELSLSGPYEYTVVH